MNGSLTVNLSGLLDRDRVDMYSLRHDVIHAGSGGPVFAVIAPQKSVLRYRVLSCMHIMN